MQDWNAYVRETQDSLRVLAEETGGIAVVNQNDFDKALKRIDAETSDYYVLGYYSTNPDPLRRTRRIEVRTTRPNVTHPVASRVHAATGPAAGAQLALAGQYVASGFSRTSVRLRRTLRYGLTAVRLRPTTYDLLARAGRDRRFQTRPHGFEDPDHFRHRSAAGGSSSDRSSRSAASAVAGDAAAEQLLVRTSAAAACHGMMLMPRPCRTIALMISTFSVSMMMSGSMPSRVKNSSTSRRVIDPVSNRTNGCLSRSAGDDRLLLRQRMRRDR